MKPRTQPTLHARIKRILDRAPIDLWVTSETTGELIPTLDLYLYIANELGVEYSIRTYPLGDLWQAVATLQHNDRTVVADALSKHPTDAPTPSPSTGRAGVGDAPPAGRAGVGDAPSTGRAGVGDAPSPPAGMVEVGERTEPDPDPTKLSQLQSRALLKAFRLYLYPHIKACQPNTRNILLATVHILYRERGYNRDERLQHATRILGNLTPIKSFNELTNTELAELIVAINISEPSSQYD